MFFLETPYEQYVIGAQSLTDSDHVIKYRVSYGAYTAVVQLQPGEPIALEGTLHSGVLCTSISVIAAGPPKLPSKLFARGERIIGIRACSFHQEALSLISWYTE
jgi:hypothetical protein